MLDLKTTVIHTNAFYLECNKKIQLLNEQIHQYVGTKILINTGFAAKFKIDLKNVHGIGGSFNCNARLDYNQYYLRIEFVQTFSVSNIAYQYKESRYVGMIDKGVLTQLIDSKVDFDKQVDSSLININPFEPIDYNEQLAIVKEYKILKAKADDLKRDFKFDKYYLNY